MPQDDLWAPAKRIAARRSEEAEPEVSRQVPRGIDALSPSPNWRLRRSARLGRSVLKGRQMYTVHVLGIDGVWREYLVFANRAVAELRTLRTITESRRVVLRRNDSGVGDSGMWRRGVVRSHDRRGGDSAAMGDGRRAA